MSFDPASLFGAGEAGAWYDPSDLATLWQDTAGTIAVTAAGQAVARIDDKSGNGKHLTQATALFQPNFQVDSAGSAYLLFDGVDDNLTAALALALPFDRISAIRQIGWSLNDRIFTAANDSCRLFQNNSSPRLRIYAGVANLVLNDGLMIGKNGIVTERYVANDGKLAVNNRPYVSGDFGATAPTSLLVGGRSTGASAANVRLFGLIVRAGALSDEEIAGTREWLAEKAAVSLGRRLSGRHSYWF